MARYSNNTFIDISTNLEIHPTKKDLLVIKDDESVKRSIRNLISTNTYERVFAPQKGGNIIANLFENIDRLTLSQIEMRVRSVIENFEPRARLLAVNATARGADNSIAVNIVFSVLGNSRPISFDVLLERAR